MIVFPVIRQHAADAVFYWRAISSSQCSILVSLARLDFFQRLLLANLDGLVLAKKAGYDVVLKDFSRFKTSGEAFVAWYVAQALGKKEVLAELWALTLKERDLAWPGVVEAVALLDARRFEEMLGAFVREGEPALLQLALDVCSLRLRRLPSGEVADFLRQVTGVLPEALKHEVPGVRAAAVRLLGDGVFRPDSVWLQAGLQDEDEAVRLEATLAVARIFPRAVTPALFNACCAVLATVYAGIKEKKGMERIVAQRDCEALAIHLAHALPCGKSVSEWLARVPETLRFLWIAHHGDPVYVPMLLEAMEAGSERARLAFWALCFVTGLEVEDSDFHAPMKSGDEDEAAGANEDAGLMMGVLAPDVVKVRAWWEGVASGFKAGVSYLKGQVVTVPLCEALFKDPDSMQAMRFAAFMHLRAQGVRTVVQDTRVASFLQGRNAF